jgi:Domain of unknown function (DUF4272)
MRVKHPTTEEWAKSFGISTAPVAPPIADYDEPCPFDAREIATRAIVLQGVVAVASQVDPKPVIEWLKEQHLWSAVSPNEQAFLLNPEAAGPDNVMRFRWRQEAEWALLWVVGKVDQLGLPIRECDTRRLVDEIIPQLGSDLEPFLSSATLRHPGELLAESDRHYNLWCQYFQTRRQNPESLPSDLNLSVLHQRQYAFEWLQGVEAWDDVRCDA